MGSHDGYVIGRRSGTDELGELSTSLDRAHARIRADADGWKSASARSSATSPTSRTISRRPSRRLQIALEQAANRSRDGELSEPSQELAQRRHLPRRAHHELAARLPAARRVESGRRQSRRRSRRDGRARRRARALLRQEPRHRARGGAPRRRPCSRDATRPPPSRRSPTWSRTRSPTAIREATWPSSSSRTNRLHAGRHRRWSGGTSGGTSAPRRTNVPLRRSAPARSVGQRARPRHHQRDLRALRMEALVRTAGAARPKREIAGPTIAPPPQP